MMDSKVIAKHEAEAKAAGLTLIGPGKNNKYRTYRFNECGHEREIRPDAVRNNEVRCRKCQEKQFIAEAKFQGLTLIGPGMAESYRNYRFNQCGHEQQIQLLAVRRHRFQCAKCVENKLNAEAEAAGLTLIGPGSRKATRIYRINKCGHQQQLYLLSVRKETVQCDQCLENKLNAEAEAAGLTLIGPGKNNNYRTYRFNECGHEREIQSGAVRVDSLICNECEETARDLPSNIYLLKIKVKSFEWLKVGYAKNVDERVKQYGLPASAQVDIIVVRPFDTGRSAHKFEASIHANFDTDRLSSRKMKRFHTLSGFDECYPIGMCETLTGELRKA